MTRSQAIFLVVTAGVALAVFLYLRKSEREQKLRGTAKYKATPKGARSSDTRVLTPQEKQITRYAKKLIAKGRHIQAAQVLEQVGLHRMAIDTLENAQLIDEAAGILLRLQRPGRAAVLYSRHKRWLDAAKCHQMDHAPLDAAKALREAGSHKEAAVLFFGEKQYKEAAECFEVSGQFVDAARSWITAGDKGKAISCWVALASQPNQMAVFTPFAGELDIMFESVKNGGRADGLLGFLSRSPKSTFMILELLSVGLTDTAKQLLSLCPAHVMPNLMSEVNLQSPSAQSLANLFQEVRQFQFAAMILEQTGKYSQAAKAFELAGDIERAKYCLERGQVSKTPSHVLAPARVDEKSLSAKGPASPQVPVGGFKIEAGEDTLNEARSASVEKGTLQPEPGKISSDQQERALSATDVLNIGDSWLFKGVDPEVVRRLCGFFHGESLKSGDTMESGSSDRFLVFVMDGSLRSNGSSAERGQWLSPELSLSDTPPQLWTALKATRVATVTFADFTKITKENSDFTRRVYINLTQRLLSGDRNQLKLKAV